MELRHLRYFVAVAESLNYRKASERLHVATPALSSQIKDLESELGVQLLDRDTRGVRLTNAGNAFLAEARLILRHSQHAVDVARDAETGRRGRLCIGFTEPTLMGFMPAALMAFHENFPAVDVDLVELSIRDQITALESGAIQIGFSIAVDARLPRGLQHVTIAHSPVRAVLERGHPLAAADRVSLADLAGEPLLCFLPRMESNTLHGEIMGRIFSARGLKVGPIRQIVGAEAYRAALEGGMGVSLVPEIGGLSRSRTLVFKHLTDIGADLSVNLKTLWYDAPASQITTNFIAVMREVAPMKMSRAKSG